MTSKFSRVSGFNPRFIVWWIKGCRSPVPATFPTRRLATATRQNLYALRTAMHLEGHHAASMIDRGEIIRRPVQAHATSIDDPHILIIRPVNFDMNDILDAAGIEAPALTDDEPILEEPMTFDACPRPFDYASIMKSPVVEGDGPPDGDEKDNSDD